MSKQTVAVIFGGASSEYEVSLLSAAAVIENVPAKLYDVVMLGITKDGVWYEYTGTTDDMRKNLWLASGKVRRAIISPDRETHGVLILEDSSVIKIDVAFPVLHGKNGEDGTIQGLLEMAGIPCVGCGVLASAMCMDKSITHTILDKAGILTAKWERVMQHEMGSFAAIEEKLSARLGYPMFVKPANAGSSVGVSKVGGRTELKAALEVAFQHDRKAIVEEAIVGAEVECAVLGNLDAAASILGEIEPIKEFYDYEAKYLDGTTALYIPARVKESVSDRLRKIAVDAYHALCCEGFSRVDFFVTPDDRIILNEINTIPGFTPISMYPKMWEATGVPFPQLVEKLLQYAVTKG